MKIEICANSVQSAVTAQEGGAHRIELCCNLAAGGLTPSAGTIQLVRKVLAIEVFVLIRPRIGDFTYTDWEMETMLKEVLYCREQGIDGVVIGILKKDQTIDLERMAPLIEAARPMQVTFHRAFDCIPDTTKGLEQLVDLSIDRVLTSGQAPSAIQGKEVLKKLVQQADNRLHILAGAGLNRQNVKELVAYTGVPEVHLSAKQQVHPTASNLFAASYFETNLEEVVEVVSLLC